MDVTTRSGRARARTQWTQIEISKDRRKFPSHRYFSASHRIDFGYLTICSRMKPDTSHFMQRIAYGLLLCFLLWIRRWYWNFDQNACTRAKINCYLPRRGSQNDDEDQTHHTDYIYWEHVKQLDGKLSWFVQLVNAISNFEFVHKSHDRRKHFGSIQIEI